MAGGVPLFLRPNSGEWREGLCIVLKNGLIMLVWRSILKSSTAVRTASLNSTNNWGSQLREWF